MALAGAERSLLFPPQTSSGFQASRSTTGETGLRDIMLI